MPLRNTQEAYGSLAKFLHWAIVLLIVPQYFLAEAAEELPNGLEKLQLINWHKSLGMLVLLLTLARIGWKIMNRGLPGPVGEPWQRKAAAAGHGLLYLLVLAQPISGWAMSSAANYPVTLFGWFQFPALVAENHDLHEALEEVHEVLFFVMLAVAVVHIAAALYHHVVLKDGVLRRMLPFSRPSA
jgi:cytochrome b561